MLTIRIKNISLSLHNFCSYYLITNIDIEFGGKFEQTISIYVGNIQFSFDVHHDILICVGMLKCKRTPLIKQITWQKKHREYNIFK